MEPRRTPVRRVGLAGLAALLVFGASACSGGTGLVGKAPAATVDDSEISQADVVAATEATQRFYEYSIDQGQDTDGTLATLAEEMDGTGAYTVGTGGAAGVLSDMVVDQVISDELARNDALPTKDDEQAIREQLETSVGGAAELKKFGEAYIASYIERRALNEAFTAWAAAEADAAAEPFTAEEREAQMRPIYDEEYADRPLCLNAIQTTTEQEATTAREQVEAGEDFAAIAQTFAGSQLPEPGVILCFSVEQASTAFGQDFAGVAADQLVGPISYAPQGAQPTFLLFRVESIDGLTYDEALPQLEFRVPEQPAPTDPTSFDASAILDELLGDADIEVNPVFGRWSAAQRAVVPPSVPGAPVASTVPALTGS